MSLERTPWQDRFNTPTPEQLRAGLPAAPARIFDSARRHLKSRRDVTETVAWYGQSWCWSLEYRISSPGPDDDPLAIIIPAPLDLQYAMPLERKFASALPVKRLKRAVRDGLELGQDPFDTRWAVWSLQPGLLEELHTVLERKLNHLAAAV